MRNNHNTEKIAIKSAHIDKGIKKLVLWLNGFYSVETLYSCQGLSVEEQKIATKKMEKLCDEYFPNQTKSYRIKMLEQTQQSSSYPYVSFTCNDQKHLGIIIGCIQGFKSSPSYNCINKKYDDNGFIEIKTSYDCENERLNYDIQMEYVDYADGIVVYYETIYKPRLEWKMNFIP